MEEHGWSSIKPNDRGNFILWNGILKEKEHSFTFADFVVGDGRHKVLGR